MDSTRGSTQSFDSWIFSQEKYDLESWNLQQLLKTRQVRPTYLLFLLHVHFSF